MALKQLAKAQWQPYFDRVSQVLGNAKRARIEVVGTRRGDQVEGENLELFGISYDPAKETFMVVTGVVQHTVFRPRQIYVDHDAEWLHSLEVVDEAGEQHIVILKDPLLLPG